MTYKELKKQITQLAKTRSHKKRAETCMYRANNKRHCNITSQRTCTGCRFYEPNAETIYKCALDEIAEQQERADDLAKELERITTVTQKEVDEILSVAEQLYFSGLYVTSNRIARSLGKINYQLSKKRG